MMAAEFPEILPERFSNPASYNESAKDFINEVVNGCHGTIYSNTGYYSEGTNCCSHSFNSFDSESSHHSLILEDPATTNRTSYSCEPNIHLANIQLVLKEVSESFPTAVDHNFNGRVNGDHMSDEEDEVRSNSMAGVQVKIECVDEGLGAPARRKLEVGEPGLALLKPTLYSTSPPSSYVSNESGGSCTPTPSYSELVSSSSVEYPGSEEKAFAVRGGEVAQPEEDCVVTGLEHFDDLSCHEESRRLHTANNNSQTSSSHNLPLHEPKRRSHLSHLQIFQSPHILPLPIMEMRKLSDPAIHIRRQKLKTTCEVKKQRCLSDSEAPCFQFPLYDDELKSELGGDSGYMDERYSRYQENMSAYYSSPRVSLYSSDLLSQDEGGDFSAQQRMRRVTPHPLSSPYSQDLSTQDEQPSAPNHGTMVHPRERSRRSMLKHFSQGSIGGASVGGGSTGGNSSIGASSESPSVTSLLETQSNLTCPTDILSSLGFDDFESPQLVPDRFIPKELEYLRPSSMKAANIEQNLSPDPTPRSPDSLTSGNSSNLGQFNQQRIVVDFSDLPLGATAENYLPGTSRPSSPVAACLSKSLKEDDESRMPRSPSDAMPLFTDTAAIAGFTRSRVLETVPEETASDLSLSPRWLSPRVSIDHSVSVVDLSEDKLGANLVKKVRRRSFPTREGYRLSIGSLVESDTGDSIHLSVTSYDDEIAAEREREREGLLPAMNDDIILGMSRRRRRGVYTPPQTLLSWLSTQKTIDEEADNTDPDELPWPFNEQARLRKSLTEISLAQQMSFESTTSIAPEDNVHQIAETSDQCELSLSPISTPNSRLSPQPTVSEADEDEFSLDAPERAAKQSCAQQDQGGFNISDSKAKPQDCNSFVTVDNRDSMHCEPNNGESEMQCHAGASRYTVDQTNRVTTSNSSLLLPQQSGAGYLVLPSISSSDGVRQRKAPVTSLGTSNTPLQHLDDKARRPYSLFSESRPPLPGSSSSEGIGSDMPVDGDMNEQLPSMVSIASSVVSLAGSPKSSPTTNRRSSRLFSLRQNSIESQLDSLPAEIELLTGEVHSPVLSPRKCKPTLKKQKSFDECGTSVIRSSRRVAIIGEAPSTAELFAATTIAENQNEVGKYIIL